MNRQTVLWISGNSPKQFKGLLRNRWANLGVSPQPSNPFLRPASGRSPIPGYTNPFENLTIKSIMRPPLRLGFVFSTALLSGSLALVSCGPDTSTGGGGPSGPIYLAGLRKEGSNPYARGRSEEETSYIMKKDNVSYWDGDGVPGSPAITIDLSQQRAFFYKDRKLVGVSKISTGTNENATPTGDFKITQKNKDHESNLYGEYKYPDGSIAQKDVDTTRDPKPPGTIYDGTDMPYFMRFHGGVGMHTGYLPGYAASHGCVRMPHYMAQKFFENVSIGTPVHVVD